MIKIILVFCLTIIFNFYPLVATAQEDGWKNLKWGMTLQEVKTAYKTINNDEGRCKDIEESFFNGSSDLVYAKDKRFGKDKSLRWIDLPANIRDMLDDLWIMCNDPNGFIDTHIFFYNNKLFGKRVDVDFGDATTHEIVIKGLKEKYPTISVKRTFKYPIVEYASERITVLSTSNALYFYDTKTLNKILDAVTNERIKENKIKQEKLESLF